LTIVQLLPRSWLRTMGFEVRKALLVVESPPVRISVAQGAANEPAADARDPAAPFDNSIYSGE
jgi:hypothetical protein